jgi:hypothetical protein
MIEIARQNSKRPRRETIYLGWKNHGRIIARFLLLWGIYHLTLWQALCIRQYVQAISSAPESRIPLASFLEGFVRQNGWMVLYAAAFSILLLWHLVSLTHRIVGPLKRVEGCLNALIDGKSVRQIEFRKSDLIQDFEQAFNAYLAFLYGSSVEAEAAAARHREAIAKLPNPLTTAGDGCDSRPSEEHIAALLSEIQSISGSVQAGAPN